MLASNETYFVTGTDTGVGKTFVSLQLLHYFKKQGLSTLALKPIASGCEETANGLMNEDALALQAAASIKLPYHHVNPFAFLPPIAPHIAANQVGVTLSVAALTQTLTPILQTQADIKLIEGAGGWLLPLNKMETLADYIETLNVKIILVVKMQLGCLNHALLTAKEIKNRGLTLAGWVANTINEPMPYLNENIETLSEHFNMTPLAF
ncbi:MAG TPA: dethiobiotin synthase [Gammaproteobacteria bacterium]|nr:dethiobiotin synthase [Gammaproteobacteria bacterium]